MMYKDYAMTGTWGIPGAMMWVFPFVLVDLILKGFALWRSARRGEQWWFMAILIINSFGIVPGIYLLTHPEKTKAVTKKK